MTARDKAALRRLAGDGAETDVSVDGLQGLLLQISFAIMMVFIVAFFLFRAENERKQDRRQDEETHHRIVTAADRVEEEYRTRYGLNLLCRAGADGSVDFEPSSVITGEGLAVAPVVRRAFREGTRYAAADYADTLALAGAWKRRTLELAERDEASLKPEDRAWLAHRLETGIGAVRADVFGLQRACAAELQRSWLAGKALAGAKDVKKILDRFREADPERRAGAAAELAAFLKRRSLARLAELAEGDLLK